LKLLSGDRHFEGGCRTVESDGRVGVGSPLYVGSGWNTGDIVLDKNLLSAVQESDTSSDGGGPGCQHWPL
jgi:hypothetical protein